LPKLDYHPLADIFPLLDGKAYEAFRDNIHQHGQGDDIITFEGKILDGRNRYRACLELGVTPRLREWDGKGSPADYVWSKNAERRHLTESQRAMAAAALLEWKKKDAERRLLAGKAHGPVANLPQGRSRDQAADKLKVSPRSVQSATKVRQKGTPELVKAVQDGTVSVSAAADLADLSPKKQREAVAKGKKEVAARAKAVRDRKARERAGEGKAGTKDDKKVAAISVKVADPADRIAGQLFEQLGAARAAEVRDALSALITQDGDDKDEATASE
jgi:hypothetical protein